MLPFGVKKKKKMAYSSACCSHTIDKVLPQHALSSSVRSNRFSMVTFGSKKTKIATAVMQNSRFRMVVQKPRGFMLDGSRSEWGRVVGL